uniref:Uncharacterized protein n=1 Tax=Romanomermis culicivorax TaxID=13658 RepID=A0A915KS14_ROMCU
MGIAFLQASFIEVNNFSTKRRTSISSERSTEKNVEFEKERPDQVLLWFKVDASDVLSEQRDEAVIYMCSTILTFKSRLWDDFLGFFTSTNDSVSDGVGFVSHSGGRTYLGAHFNTRSSLEHAPFADRAFIAASGVASIKAAQDACCDISFICRKETLKCLIFKNAVLLFLILLYKTMDNADLRSEEIDVGIAQRIYVDDQLFSIVENPRFIKLITKALQDETKVTFRFNCKNLNAKDE